MKNEEKIKVCLERMLNIFRGGIGDFIDEGIGFYNPIRAGMEIGIISEELDEIVKLLEYQKSINDKNIIELMKIN